MIRPGDRVSTVLARDEELIDVFVEMSPAFERLRNPAMRKVMSRLVTVEAAARIAGVDPDELVRRLNAGPEQDSGRSRIPRAGGAAPAAGPPGLPPVLRALPDDTVIDLDVREDLRAGREPFSRIMAARKEVPTPGALRLRAIFEPVPLYDVLGRQGFEHWTERLGEEDWTVWFYRVAEGEDAGASGADRSGGEDAPSDAGRASSEVAPDLPASGSPTSDEGEAPVGDDDVVVLDVRGLGPPEPMVRTLEALESLPPGGTLVQLNVRVPRFLLPILEERGFTWEVRDQEDGPVRVFIRRAEA